MSENVSRGGQDGHGTCRENNKIELSAKKNLGFDGEENDWRKCPCRWQKKRKKVGIEGQKGRTEFPR